jgi:hypothetical protein
MQPSADARSLTLREDYVQETVAAMGKITYENAPNFVEAEAKIVRICSGVPKGGGVQTPRNS